MMILYVHTCSTINRVQQLMHIIIGLYKLYRVK